LWFTSIPVKVLLSFYRYDFLEFKNIFCLLLLQNDRSSQYIWYVVYNDRVYRYLVVAYTTYMMITITYNILRVYYDVYDWLFRALFIEREAYVLMNIERNAFICCVAIWRCHMLAIASANHNSMIIYKDRPS